MTAPTAQIVTCWALGAALLEGGLTNYPSEYWHWSYGDQGWAYRTGANQALYGVTLDVFAMIMLVGAAWVSYLAGSHGFVAGLNR